MQHLLQKTLHDDFVGISLAYLDISGFGSFLLARNIPCFRQVENFPTVSGMVTFIAAVHYFYMRDVWVATGDTPTVYRYIDWLITVPLLMVEFYLIACDPNVSSGIFWRLIIGTMVMLVGGYAGEAGYINVTRPVIGMAGWIYVLYEICWPAN